MQTPVEIDFQGIEARPDVRTTIAHHVSELEGRYGRITACRVVLKGAGGHHRTGGLYEVNIRLALPDGREVIVGRTAQMDERHSDLTFAVNDAFNRARRQLQDQVKKMRGDIKQHEPQPTGRVARIDESGEFGFIETNDGREIYFHRNSVIDIDISQIAVGSRVTFAESEGVKGPQASTVRLLGKHTLRL